MGEMVWGGGGGARWGRCVRWGEVVCEAGEAYPPEFMWRQPWCLAQNALSRPDRELSVCEPQAC